MTFERSDYLKIAEKGRKVADLTKVATMLDQAAVDATAMTNSPTWNIFLQHVQAAIDTTRKVRDAHERVMRDPLVVNHDQIMTAKLGFVEANATITAWEAVLSLPKEIIERGDRARGLLHEREQ